MKEHVFIGIDCGKHSCKGIMEYKGKTFITLFRTKMQMTSDFGMELQPHSYKVVFDNEEYVLGEMVSEDFSDNNLSKENLIHKVAVYTAIVELMKKAKLQEQFDNIELHVAINAPINVYKSQRLKASYKQYVENGKQPVSIHINDKLYTFRLEDVAICFEGMGLVYQDTAAFTKHSSVILDIGGLNTTMCIFNGIHPDFNSMIVSNLGIISLKAKVERQLVEKYGVSVSSNDLEQIIKNGFFSHAGKKIEESEEMIKKIRKNHLESIINYAKQHGYTFNQDKIFIVGGGALLLNSEIEKAFPDSSLVINPQFANVRSFLEIIKVKHAG